LSQFTDFIGDSETRSFEEGEIIFAQGAPADGYMYALLEGNIQLDRQGAVLEVVSEGGVFGELALIDNEPRSATARATQASRLALISQERFRELILRNPSFALEIMRLLTRRIRANLER
jgi:CRP-like cAMP-binding protein